MVTVSDRMAEEELIFTANSMALIELYFFGKFGLSVRSSLKLPLLAFPKSAEETVGAYTLGLATFDGHENLALLDAAGSAIAITASGKIAGTTELVCLSLYLTSSADEVMASYLAPSGRPLFTVRKV